MLKYPTMVQCLVLSGALGALVGCSESDKTLFVPIDEPDPNLPRFTGSALVDEGGAVISTGGTRVTIPPGALAEPVEIVVEDVQSGFPEFDAASDEQIVAFMPHGTQFLTPVTIQVPHSHETSTGLSLYTANPDQPWVTVPGATFNAAAAVAQVSHFSFFFASNYVFSEPGAGGSGSGGTGSAGTGNAGTGNAGTGNAGTGNAGTGGASAGQGGAGGQGGSAGEGGVGGTVGEGGDGGVGGTVGEGGDGGVGGTVGEGGDGGVGGTVGEGGVGGTVGEGGSAGEGGVGGTVGEGGSAGEGGVGGTVGEGGSASAGEGGAAGAAGVGGEGGEAGEAGSAGQGGGSAGTAGEGGAGGGGPDTEVDYLENEDWHGYLYTQPAGLASIERFGVCASGEVPADETYGSYAQWAWNINQDPAGVSSTWTPTTTTIAYDISTTFGEPLRLHVYDASYQTWCFVVEEPSGEVDLTAFNTQCWSNGGTFYDGSTPIMGVRVEVPGSPSVDQPFDFCVNELAPVADGGGGEGGSGGEGGAGGGAGEGGEAGEAGSAGEGGSAGAGEGGAAGAGGEAGAAGAGGEGGAAGVGGEGGEAGEAGSAGQGGGSAGTAGEGGAGGGGPDIEVDYLENEDWHGYLYTQDAGLASIERFGVCASGEVPADETYGSYAQWAWNINQDPAGVSSTWTPTTTTIAYDISTTFGEPLRLHIYDASYQTWCFVVEEPSGEVDLTAFNTQCWSNGGAFYDGSTPIMGVRVEVPGSPSVDQPFDFCVNELAPVADGGGGEGGSGGEGGAGGGAGEAGSAGEGGGGPVNLITNSDFETGVSGWVAHNGGASIDQSSLQAHSGDFSLLSWNRTGAWQGPGIDLLGVVTPGVTYRATAYVRTSVAANVHMTLQQVCAGGTTNYDTIRYNVPVLDSEWTEITGTKLVRTIDGEGPAPCTLSAVRLYLEGPAAGVDIFVDDVSFVAEP